MCTGAGLLTVAVRPVAPCRRTRAAPPPRMRRSRVRGDSCKHSRPRPSAALTDPAPPPVVLSFLWLCAGSTVEEKFPAALRQQDLDPLITRLDKNLLQLTPMFAQAGATVRVRITHRL